MKKHVKSFCFFLSLTLFVLSPLYGRTGDLKLRVTVQTAKIRISPDVNSSVIREIKIGTILSPEIKQGSWYKILLPADEEGFTLIGFIHEDDVEAFEEEEKKVAEKKEKAEEIPEQITFTQPPLPSETSGFRIGLGMKFSGGLSFLLNGAGDLENLRLGRKDYYEDWGQEENYTSAFNWSRMTFIPDFHADLIITLGNHFGIGFGSGFIKASVRGEYSIGYDYTEYWGDYSYFINEDYVRNYTIKAIPLRFNFYLFFPLNNFSFFFSAGAGYYLGKLTNNYTFDNYFYYESPDGSPTYKHEEDYEWLADEESTCKTIGFQGGLGFEVKIPPFMSLGIEFFGRYANFTDWEGTRSYSWTEADKYWSNSSGWYSEITDQDSGEFKGKLWIYDYYSSYMDEGYANMWIRDDEPSGSSYLNVKQSAINLNTAGILLFFKIHFNLF